MKNLVIALFSGFKKTIFMNLKHTLAEKSDASVLRVRCEHEPFHSSRFFVMLAGDNSPRERTCFATLRSAVRSLAHSLPPPLPSKRVFTAATIEGRPTHTRSAMEGEPCMYRSHANRSFLTLLLGRHFPPPHGILSRVTRRGSSGNRARRQEVWSHPFRAAGTVRASSIELVEENILLKTQEPFLGLVFKCNE